MSNLSELLPAGSSVKSADFVAQGTLASGVTVGLRSDGKVEAITAVSNSQYIPWSSETQFNAATTQSTSVEYNPLDSTRFVVGYNSGSGPKLVVGTVTDNGSTASISYSTPVTVSTNAINQCELQFQPNTNKFVFIYQDDTGSKLGIAKMYSISGTTLTLLDTETFDSGGNSSGLSMDFSSKTTGLFVVGYFPYATGTYAKTRTGVISGNSLTFGTEYTVYSFRGSYSAVAFLDNSDSFVYLWKLFGNSSGSDGFGEAKIGTVAADNSSISFGSIQQWSTDQNQGPTNIMVAANRNLPNSFTFIYTWNGSSPAYGTIAQACTVSGTTITFGATSAVTNWYANGPSDIKCYGENKFLVVYDGEYLGSNPQYGMYVRPFTTSGNTISFGTQVQVIAPGSRGGNGRIDLGLAPNDAQFAVTYRAASNYGWSILGELASVSTNVSSYVGFTDQAISSAATGKVVCKGGVITNSNLSLNVGSTYYVQDNGTITTTSSTTKAGTALSTTSLLITG